MKATVIKTLLITAMELIIKALQEKVKTLK